MPAPQECAAEPRPDCQAGGCGVHACTARHPSLCGGAHRVSAWVTAGQLRMSGGGRGGWGQLHCAVQCKRAGKVARHAALNRRAPAPPAPTNAARWTTWRPSSSGMKRSAPALWISSLLAPCCTNSALVRGRAVARSLRWCLVGARVCGWCGQVGRLGEDASCPPAR